MTTQAIFAHASSRFRGKGGIGSVSSFGRRVGNTAGDAECTSLAAVRCASRLVQTRGVVATSVGVLQGRQPPSVEWPRAGAQQTRQPGPPQGSRRPHDVQSERPKQKAQNVTDRGSRNLDEIVTEARNGCRSWRLPSWHRARAIQPSLKKSLRQARLQTKVLPVEDRIEETKLFIERSKKRVGALREEVSRAQLIVQETGAITVESCDCRHWSAKPRGCQNHLRQFERILHRNWRN